MMLNVASESLQPGAQLAEAVKDRFGRVLIPEGVIVGDRHIRALKIRGVSSVCIVGDGEAAADERQPRIDPVLLQRAKIQAAKIFRLNAANRHTPILLQLYSQTVMRLVREEYCKSESSPEQVESGPGTAAAENHQNHAAGAVGQDLPTVAELIASTRNIATLPAVHHELMEVVNHPHSSAADVAKVISTDPGLTARLLRIVNSVFYSFPARIDTVSRAITIIGMAELSELAFATSVLKLFAGSLSGVVDMELFWRHSVSCGVFARILAQRRREPNGERFFVTGLLHDLGRLVMFSQLPDLSRQAISQAEELGQPLHAVERELLGFTHADAGRELLAAWNLPVSQQEVVGLHHSPLLDKQFPLASSIVHVADFTANAMRLGRSGSVLLPPLDPRAWDNLGLDSALLPEIVEEADAQVSELMRIFNQD